MEMSLKTIYKMIKAPWDEIELEGWFRSLGSSLTHFHITTADNSDSGARLRWMSEFIREQYKIIKQNGYKGSFTLEFVEGTNKPDENIEKLYQCALEDKEFLKEIIQG